MTPQKQPDDLADFMATLDADFGKKPKKQQSDNDIARKRNTKFHSENPGTNSASGKSPELDQSGNWQPKARVTYVIRQTCNCCNNTVEFIGGEYIQWRSKKQHASILRRADHSPNLFLYDKDGEPLLDLIDEFNQQVSRCPGCIAVEKSALEIWESATVEKQPELPVTPQELETQGAILKLDIKIEGA